MEEAGQSGTAAAAKKRMAVMALSAVILAGSSMMTACNAADSEPVIAERTTGQSGETDPYTGLAVTDSSEDSRTGQSVYQGQQSLRLQAEAPERYQAEMQSQYLVISADVPVTVPDVSAIPARKVEKGDPYTESELEHLKKVVNGTEGIDWDENQFVKEKNGGYTSCQSKDGTYYLSFQDGAASNGDGGDTHMMWISNKTENAGSSADYSADDLSGMNFSQQEQERIEQQLVSKAQEILKQLDLGDFQITSCRWKRVLKYDAKWVPDGRYAVAIRFARIIDGVPEPSNFASALGQISSSCQYVDVVYADDGELLEFKNINREKYGDIVEESGFLLPFESITQIFQQYCRNFYETSQPEYVTYSNQPDELPLAKADGQSALAHMTLSDVKLEYMPIYEYDQNGTPSAVGKIVPVWNFYGGMTVGFQDENRNGSTRANLTAVTDMLLLSVDARDGKVYGR